MAQDKLELSLLLDYYGSFLTEKQRDIICLWVDEDMSLAEIAEMKNISRQGGRDAIQRSEKQLNDMENKLGLVRRDGEIRKLLENLDSELRSSSVNAQAHELIEKLISIMEGENGI